ncbi:hypothetical protein D3C83_06360 [compost metagenome]
MRDAGFHEFVSGNRETVLRVKAHGVGLRVQPDRIESRRSCQVQQQIEDGAAPTPAPPRFQHRHAADMPVGQKPPGADSLAFGRECQHMTAARVGIVPFQFLGHMLLLDEDRPPDRMQFGAPLVPVDLARYQVGIHGRIV